MRPPIVFLFIAIIALGIASRHAGAYQHVANGGFEQGLDGWSVAPGTDASVVGLPEVAPAEGNAATRFVLGGAASIVRQRTNGALAAGTYTMTVQARTSSDARLALAVLPAGTNQQIEVANLRITPQWDEIGGTFTLIASAEVIVTLNLSGTPGALAYIDDVRLDGAAPVTLSATPLATSTSTPAAPLAEETAAPSPGASPTATATVAAVLDVIAPSLRNGGFESLDPAGLPFAWEKYGGVLSSNSAGRSGARSARLESATTATKWLHQAVTVHPKSWYAFDTWILHDDPAVASAFLRVSWYATSDASGASIDASDSTMRLDAPADGYRRLTTDAIQAPADARSARVRVMLAPVSASRASIVVDDAAWTETSAPPPTPSATPAALAPEAATPRETAAGSAARSSSRRSTSASGASARGGIVLPSATESTSIVINEVLYDADVADVPDPDAEWVELYNRGEVPIDVTGWALQDGRNIDVLAALTVPPHGFAIIAATAAFHDAHPEVAAPIVVLDGRIGNALGNDGDRLYLVDPAGRAVDAVSWGDDKAAFDPAVDDVPAGHSIERRVSGVDSDQAADFSDNERPSPGASFEAVGAKPRQQNSASTIDVLSGSGERNWDWLPWALVAASGAMCAGTLGWRTFSVVRDRVRHP
jgi:hypothetical protein